MSEPDQTSSTKQAVAAGASIGTASLLAIVGILGFFQGLGSILKGPTFVIGFDYVFKIDPTGWGWIHLIVGLAAIAIAVGLFLRKTWAAVGAIVIAAISIVINFLWMPYYPAWSLVVIALDIFIIWSVSTWRQHALAQD